MVTYMDCMRRLPLDGLFNARELGGYPVPGGMTKYGVFVRSEIPLFLTKGDIEVLKNYGITADIDLRGDVEAERMKDVLMDEPWLEYARISLFDNRLVLGMKDSAGDLPGDFAWGKYYIGMAESSRDWIKAVLEKLEKTGGAALFHCTTGKDRTGIITAMLLGLCGVSESDIVADYCVSQVYLEPVYPRLEKLMPPIPGRGGVDRSFMGTLPESMSQLLGYLNESFGGVRGYLESCSLTEETLESLRSRLIHRI